MIWANSGLAIKCRQKIRQCSQKETATRFYLKRFIKEQTQARVKVIILTQKTKALTPFKIIFKSVLLIQTNGRLKNQNTKEIIYLCSCTAFKATQATCVYYVITLHSDTHKRCSCAVKKTNQIPKEISKRWDKSQLNKFRPILTNGVQPMHQVEYH